jgi:hypothetical protein
LATAIAPPALAVKVTATPGIRVLDALLASTVMVAPEDPSDGIVGTLDLIEIDAAVTVPPPEVPPEVPLELPPLEDPTVPSVALPLPQPASRARLRQVITDNLRIALVPHRSGRRQKSVNV